MTLNNKKGFTLIELLVALFIISILVAVAVPQFSRYQARVYDTAAQSNLRSVFQACQDFWTFNSSDNSCLLTTVSNSDNGFIPSAAVEITIQSDANNTEYDFYATASHISSSNTFEIDYRGAVSKVSGNNGRGCSEEAQNGSPLGQEAAGGCGTSSNGNNGGNNGGNNF